MRKVLFLLSIVWMLNGCEQQQPPIEDVYPWQITILPNGNSRVFGISFGSTSLQEAKAILGSRYDAGLFENPDGSLSLEIYFNEVTLGGISGKFILSLDAGQETLQSFKQAAVKAQRMESGARRYRLSQQDQLRLGGMTISALGYIPYVDLDEPMINQRFGMPSRIIRIAEGKQHYLYPNKGLDLLLDREGKEFLQYVAPNQFERLQAPLLRQYDS